MHTHTGPHRKACTYMHTHTHISKVKSQAYTPCTHMQPFLGRKLDIHVYACIPTLIYTLMHLHAVCTHVCANTCIYTYF